jgi:hypothetical protein
MKESTTTTNTSSPKIELSDFIENEPPEIVEAKAMARRYRLPYIDLLPTDAESPIDYEQLAGRACRDDAQESFCSIEA